MKHTEVVVGLVPWDCFAGLAGGGGAGEVP